MKRLVLIVFILGAFWVQAQVVIEISYTGLTKTKPNYLGQFLAFKPGDNLDSTRLEETRQRLVNLPMFGEVSYEVYITQDQAKVTYRLQELYTILPIFSFGGIKENFWIQGGVSEVNLWGGGNRLTTYYQYYDRSSFSTHLTLDRIKQSAWGVNINLIKWSTLEPLYFAGNTIEYEYDNHTFGLNAIHHFNFRDQLIFGGAYFTEDYRKFTIGTFEGAPEKVNKKKLLGKMIFISNRVNHHFFYLDGWHNQLNIQTVQTLDSDPAFYIIFNDIKRFIRVGARGNFASRFRLGLSSNEESPFAPFVLDSYINIRGVGNRVDRGTGAIILNVEYRHSFIERDRLALQGVMFSDSGSWRNPGGYFSDFADPKNFVLFAGPGFRLIHKKIYNAILRIDYGFNLQNPQANGFVLGIGQYF